MHAGPSAASPAMVFLLTCTLVPATASAQTASGGPASTARTPVSSASSGPSEPQEDVIEVTAPPPRSILPRPPAADEDDDEEEETPPVVQPPPSPPPEPREVIDAIWRRHLALGVTVGAASPFGALGAFVDGNIGPLGGLTIGVSSGATFGPALGFAINVHPFRFRRFAPYVSVGASTNFTPPAYRVDPLLQSPSNSYWFNAEVGFEYRARVGVFVRIGAGASVLLNTGDFSNVQVLDRYGPATNTTIGADPVSAADAHDAGNALAFPYIHVDLGYLIPI